MERQAHKQNCATCKPSRKLSERLVEYRLTRQRLRTPLGAFLRVAYMHVQLAWLSPNCALMHRGGEAVFRKLFNWAHERLTTLSSDNRLGLARTRPVG